MRIREGGRVVRTAAVRLVAEVYRMRKSGGQPFEVEKLLGAGVKPALLQVLHRRFGEVDEEIAGGVRPAGSAGGPGGRGVINRDDMPVGPGISIRASGSFNRMGSALPPISGRGGTLPALAVVGSSRGSSRPGTGAFSGGLDAGGKPPRTPLSPGGGGGGGPRGRTPPRMGRLGTAEGPGGSLRGGVGSPLRGSRGNTPLGGGAMLPGSMPGDGGDGADVMIIHSGGSTPARGNSSQSVRGNSGQSVRVSTSLKARTKGGGGPGGASLDDAEEQLIEYILNDEARAVV
ncbi:hypothetical protein TSOC_009753 [Tetrabaena socialis]|uniref:Uncharacterized protein n=1 Tax=Tetrabaena socialis TaxID=47790 RepID=A0A2J7ZV19_9CHLO|nr:hypothetical protein TSOC_009753 [Tetrabaena socialis]|eukprot:PNH04127.1 hypothetical protein TSOC_009753 [Tetrabaena socialis]